VRFDEGEAGDPGGHKDNRPIQESFSSVTVDQVPILLGFKSLSNTKAIQVVHLYFAEVERKAYGNEDEPQANESDGCLGVYGFHLSFFLPVNFTVPG
jgi:hypothetical protein